jgi:DNA-binding SARP family transcriptional activator
LLGAPRLVLAQGHPHTLERRDAALLAWLALHGPTPRSRLVRLLWPDLPTRTAQTNLRQRLFRMKQRAGHEIVVSDPLLKLARGVEHDLQAEPSGVGSDPALNEAPLLGALAYEDCGELGEWVASSRERWDGERRKRLAQRAAELESQGRIAEALAYAERLTLEAPTAEHAHRRVMRLHSRRGDRSAALAAFERCREVLARELGTRPGDETRELAALIERSGALPPPVAAPSPVTTLRPPRLIGREREWRALEAAWQRRQPVLILGEPGIGKSRLAADFAAAQNQPHAHRAHFGDARVPYSLLARLLRDLIQRHGRIPQAWIETEFSRLLPELGEPRPGKLEPVRLRQAIAEAMAHWQAAGLAALVIDDLHFADEASLEWLLAWLEDGAGTPIVMTVRAGEVPSLLRDWLHERKADGLCELPLAPLAGAEVAALLDSLAIAGIDAAAWAEPLARYTGGNPLFMLETLKVQLAKPASPSMTGKAPSLRAPSQIGRLLDRRLDQLPADALRLARVAALAGPDHSADLAARVLGCHVLDLTEAWFDLERAQIVVAGAFAHDLILEATLRSVPEAVAVPMHCAIALALESDSGVPARVAHHWHRAREWARAAPHFERAARAAHLASRPAESLAMWDLAAASHAQVGAHDAAFAARREAIDPAIVIGPPDQAQARVEALLADSRTDAQRMDALIGQALHLATGGQFAKVLPVSAEALALARQVGDRRGEFKALNGHGVSLALTGRVADGLALFESMSANVAEARDDGVESEFWGCYAYALSVSGRFREAATGFQRAADLAERLGDTNQLAIQTGNLSLALGHLGQTELALEAALRAHATHARLGELKGEPYAVSLLNIGMFYLVVGRFAEGIAVFEQALQLVRDGQASRLCYAIEGHLANAYLRLGQPARARQILSPLNDGANPAYRARRQILDWRIRSLGGDASAEPLLRALEELGSRLPAMDRYGLELAVAAAVPAAEGIAWSQRIRDDALATGQTSVALTALARLADAQRREGLREQAAASARQAVAERVGCSHHDLPVPDLWWLCFGAFDGAGCEGEAHDALRQGANWTIRSLPHVPEAFRDSYLNRSPVVPRLLAMAKRRLGV